MQDTDLYKLAAEVIGDTSASIKYEVNQEQTANFPKAIVAAYNKYTEKESDGGKQRIVDGFTLNFTDIYTRGTKEDAAQVFDTFINRVQMKKDASEKASEETSFTSSISKANKPEPGALKRAQDGDDKPIGNGLGAA